ncbi:MAG: SCO family protein [Myxococcota bacterium]|nr:SCO family protein [Myxococcota bacterium]
MRKVLAVMAASLAVVALGAEPALPGDSVYRVEAKFKTDEGKAFALASLRGRPVILAFAYTTCGSTCPLAMRKLKLLEAQLGDRRGAVDFVVVSLDPEKDTPQTLANFRKHQGITAANWHLLTGVVADTRLLAMAVGFKFAKVAQTGQVMHDNKLFRLDDEGRVAAVVTSLDEDTSALLVGVP